MSGFIGKIQNGISGSAQGGFNATKLGAVDIPIPPLREQERIVSILDKVFSVIEQAKQNAEKNLKNAKELFDSYLNNIFTNRGDDWEIKKLGEVLEKTETIDPTKQPDKTFIYLDVSSVNKETKQIEFPNTILGIDAPSRARKLVKENDVIFATVRPTHCRVALITPKYNNQVCSTGYFVIRTKSEMISKYIFYFLLTFDFMRNMERLQKGANYPAVSENEVKDIIINYPKSLIKQKEIIEKLDSLSIETKQLEQAYQQKITELEDLKKAVLQKAFNGNLKEIKYENF